jgi:large subunit ribosomal protein L28
MSSGKNCQNCGKGVMYGHEVSHAKNRSRRTFDPNLHVARVMIDGAMKRTKLCAKCIRKLKKEVVKKNAASKTESPASAIA